MVKSDADRIVVVSFKIENKFNRDLEMMARYKNVTKSDIIREAVKQYLSRNMGYNGKRIRIIKL